MISNLFLSVGAMKAGTTWLYEQLKDHPEVFFTPEKEIHYYANKVGIENQLNHRSRILKLKSILQKYPNANPKFISEHIDELAWYVKFSQQRHIDNDWYVSLFSEKGQEKFCADFSNLYCQMNEDGWSNVRETACNIKVVYTLRDPLKRLWSHYKFHHKWIGKEDNVIDDGLNMFKETLSKPWFYNNMDYAGNFKKVLQGVGEDNVLLLYFEDFRTNPQNEIDRITSFLDIKNVRLEEAGKEKKVNSTKDIDMPDEWKNIAIEYLSEYEEAMVKANIWHDQWGGK